MSDFEKINPTHEQIFCTSPLRSALTELRGEDFGRNSIPSEIHRLRRAILELAEKLEGMNDD